MKPETLLNIGGRTQIAIRKILLMRAESNYTKIHLEDGSTILSSTTLGILEKRLQNFPFYRPNRSVIINLDFMVEFEEASAQIKMRNNEIFKISRRRTIHFYTISEQSSNPKTKNLFWWKDWKLGEVLTRTSY